MLSIFGYFHVGLMFPRVPGKTILTMNCFRVSNEAHYHQVLSAIVANLSMIREPKEILATGYLTWKGKNYRYHLTLKLMTFIEFRLDPSSRIRPSAHCSRPMNPITGIAFVIWFAILTFNATIEYRTRTRLELHWLCITMEKISRFTPSTQTALLRAKNVWFCKQGHFY